MRMPVNRLLYGLVGAALAAGLVVSVFERPQPRLAAAETCYGPCPSVTAMSLSRSTVAFGNEQAVSFTIIVASSAPGTALPTGTVTVQSGALTVCSVRLVRGLGSCSPAPRTLTPGSHAMVAHYSGDASNAPSASNSQTLTVLGQSVTGLSLSRSIVSYLFQQSVSFRVVVASNVPGTSVPTGTVTVQSAGRTLCSIRLVRGLGSCSPAARALPRGFHSIVARYNGDAHFTTSTSTASTLLVF